MKVTDRAQQEKRHDRLIRERIHDPYKTRRKLPEPTRCPQCRAYYYEGRWQWHERAAEEIHEEICQACHRLNDNYPAGWVTLGGSFIASHREELLRLASHLEQQEKEDHPLHRIMHIDHAEQQLVITTTDIHLPRRIGEALQHAYHGTLDFHYDEDAYQLRVQWRRDE